MIERIQKFLSQAGVASRRKAEEFVRSGQVTISGRKACIGDKVDPSKDIIKVFGKTVKTPSEKIYMVLNKPKGYVVSKKDPQGRKTVFSLLPENLRNKVWNVGRLDFNTEGLLILTNDGELTQALAHPKYEHDKEYEITTDLVPTEKQLEQLRQGVEIATGMTSPAKVKVKNNKIYLVICEGKKRQVRRMCNAVGLGVKSLKRVRISKLKLPAGLQPGAYQLVRKEDIL